MAQNMQLQQFPSHIPKINTEKTFFKKYSYKISFLIDEKQLKDLISSAGLSHKYWTNRAELRTELRLKIIDHLPIGTDFRTREEGFCVSLFLDDDAAAAKVANELAHCVKEIHAPTSDKHKQLMHENHKIHIRNTLFYNKYRYKVVIKNLWNDRFKNFDSLKEWLDALSCDDGEARWMANQPLSAVFSSSIEERNKPRFRYRYSHYAVFLNDERDVMMLQLWLNEWYERTEKAVLIAEI